MAWLWNKKKKNQDDGEKKAPVDTTIQDTQTKQSEPQKPLQDSPSPSIEPAATKEPTPVVDISPEEPAADNLTPEHAKPTQPRQPDEPKKSWLSRLGAGLSKSSSKLTQSLNVFSGRKLDDEALEELEEILITADLGTKTSLDLVAQIRKKRFDKSADMSDIAQDLAEIITEKISPVVGTLPQRPANHQGPFVVLVVGVNGTGKTTTIAKLAQHYRTQGHSVVMAAGDTFRAAAVEQLQIWAERTGAHFVRGEDKGDAAAVAYQALEKARVTNADIVLIDTAGRLHNKANLMEELAKIRRVIGKACDGAPHETLMTLDATTGQNAVTQVDLFNQTTPLTGLVITKLDGSARGGVVVNIADTYQMPIVAIGVGEGMDDLNSFEANAFARALVGV